MSRKADNSAERNRNTLKQLVKLETNKSCADCKRNKHPRWASWNLGIFICIRCSGIHRGMGTHISRVKSVDLDSWTDEQLQSVLKWGNTRANKYWEAKLAPGHVPAEAKIENFIRTKYESKRWVMDGPMPDPSTLETDGDDDVPLSVVQEKAKIERSASQRIASSATGPIGRAPIKRQPNVDLFGDDEPPARPSTGPPINRAPPPPKAEATKNKPADSLLGLDFLSGPTAAAPARPSSNPTVSGSGPSRPDLKQSILSLYAAKPAAVSQAQNVPPNPASPPPASSGLGSLNDAFASLSFPSTSSKPPQQQPGFDSIVRSPPPSAAAPKTASYGGGGSFFDTPSSPPPQPKPVQPAKPAPSGFGGFMTSTAAAPMSAAPAASGGNDLFDLMGDGPAAPISTPSATTSSYNNSAFNLSNPAPIGQTPAAPAAKSPSINLASNFDAWGSSNAWSDSKATTSTTKMTATPSDFGWGSSTSVGTGAPSKPAPQVSRDEDFGDWGSPSPALASVQSSAPAPAPAPAAAQKPAGGFNANNDDLFSNVWQ